MFVSSIGSIYSGSRIRSLYSGSRVSSIYSDADRRRKSRRGRKVRKTFRRKRFMGKSLRGLGQDDAEVTEAVLDTAEAEVESAEIDAEAAEADAAAAEDNKKMMMYGGLAIVAVGGIYFMTRKKK